MVISKGNKRTIVMGYGDVLRAMKVVGEKCIIQLRHYPDGYGKAGNSVDLEMKEVVKLPLLTSIQFDNIEAIDHLIEDLKNMKHEMLFNKLRGLIDDKQKNSLHK